VNDWWAGHLLYALAWVSFAAGHSLAAGEPEWLKRRFGRGHRLAYNIFAVVHLVLVVAVGRWVLGDRTAYALPAAVDWLRIAMELAGWAVLIVALRSYDLGRFAGIRQVREGAAESDPAPEPLQTGGLNGVVRHPLYVGAILVLWGLVHDDFTLATATWATAYFLIGSRYEERRLHKLYGDDYARYCRAVGGFLPRPEQGRRGVATAYRWLRRTLRIGHAD